MSSGCYLVGETTCQISSSFVEIMLCTELGTRPEFRVFYLALRLCLIRRVSVYAGWRAM